MRTTSVTDDDLRILQRTNLLATISAEDIARLANAASVMVFGRGQQIFEHGAPAERFYAILSGWVKVSNIDVHGNEAILGLFAVGETFAEAAMFMGGGYPANAQAIEETTLIAFDRKFFVSEITKNADLALGMLGALSHHAHRLTQDVEQLQTQSGDQRLAAFLLNLCPAGADRTAITLPYDKSLIAGRLGMKPETLSRAFAKLRGFGVQVKGTQVVVSEVKRLRERVA